MESYSCTKSFAKCLDYAKKVRAEFDLNYIGTEMLLYGILSTPESEACKLLGNFGCILKDYLYHFRKSLKNININSYTPKALNAIQNCQAISVKYKFTYVSTEHLLLAILKIEDCTAVAILRALGVDIAGLYSEIHKHLKEFSDNYDKNRKAMKSESISEQSNKTESEKQIKNPLDGFGYDLTLKAKERKIDPVIGRESETERIIQTLARKTKNNPILIGEAGVGKSAVVEGLAMKIIKGEVPDALRGKILFSLDLGGLVAGTKYRGEFESRFKEAIEYVKQQRNIILFIDEIHNLVGAGSSGDSKMDASEMLKPLLSRGEISIIGATTIEEYRKYIEKNQALERRFQPVYVNEPSKESAIEILKGLKPAYEAHHKIKISDEAIISAVNLSDRYIRDRFLPDKAIDLIDEAASKKRVEITSIPKIITELENEVRSLVVERDQALSKGDIDLARKAEIKATEIATKIKKEREKINSKRSSQDVTVTEKDVKNIISLWTKIPVGDLTASDVDKLMNLENELKKRIIGQDDAVSSVVRAIKRSSVKLKNPNKPIGTFIFVGPTGVGKSELSKAIAECVFSDKNALIRFDMSEYADKTAINKLIGSPPGYVGYDEEGQLTEKVRRNPYSVLLFDEIEKADSEIFDLLLQVLDEGRLTDSKGRVVDFKECIIILTSNVGFSSGEYKSSLGFGSTEDNQKYKIEQSLKQKFKPEFINRLDEVVVFNHLSKENIKTITSKMLNEVVTSSKNVGFNLVVDDSVIEFIVSKEYNREYGARPIQRAIERRVVDLLSDGILEGKIENGDTVTVYENDGEITFFDN